MTKQNEFGIEQATILTISTAHLSRDTIERIEAEKGDMSEGPSIAIREEGFLVNSYRGDDAPLDRAFTAGLFKPLAERHPDLVLIQALARGLGAEWINIDRDGVEYSDILPTYDDNGIVSVPSADGWRDALNRVGVNYWGAPVVLPERGTLEIIEAGQTPGQDLEDAPGL